MPAAPVAAPPNSNAERGTGAASPPLLLGGGLCLVALASLPLAQGGYSGAGYLIALVLLPLALAIGWPCLARRPRLAEAALLLYLLSGLALPLLVQEGRELWSWLLPLPLGWCAAWLILAGLPQRRDWLLPLLCGAAAVTAAWGLLLWALSGDTATRLSANFGLPNAYAGYLLLAWPVLQLRLLQAAARWRWLAAAALLLVLAALVLTYSRAAWLVFALQVLLGGLLFLALRRGQAAVTGQDASAAQPWPRWLPWLWLAVPLLLSLLPSVRAVLARVTEFGGHSVIGRLRFWEAALAIWRDHPWTGVGLGNFAHVYPQYQHDPWWYSVDPHSWPLQLVCELGAGGLLLALGLLLGLALWLRRLWRSLPLAEFICLALAAGGSALHAAVDFDYTFAATTSLLGVVLAYGSWRCASRTGQEAPAGRPWAGWLTMLLALAVAGWGLSFSIERFCLDRLRDTPELRSELRRDLLLQALHANPLNHQSHYRLASIYAQEGSSAGLRSARDQLEIALRLNPRYALAWAMRGLLKGRSGNGEADLAEALRLDPYNYPEHYFYYANLAADEAQRKERLENGIARIQVTRPVGPHDLRPDWMKLNGMFARWYYELARLTPDSHAAASLRSTAARFEQAAEQAGRESRQRSSAPASGG